jgi:hypothetical protein
LALDTIKNLTKAKSFACLIQKKSFPFFLHPSTLKLALKKIEKLEKCNFVCLTMTKGFVFFLPLNPKVAPGKKTLCFIFVSKP